MKRMCEIAGQLIFCIYFNENGHPVIEIKLTLEFLLLDAYVIY